MMSYRSLYLFVMQSVAVAALYAHKKHRLREVGEYPSHTLETEPLGTPGNRKGSTPFIEVTRKNVMV